MNDLDSKTLSFSQEQGYVPLPQPLRLGELNPQARVRLWNAMYQARQDNPGRFAGILRRMHSDLYDQPIDEYINDSVALTEIKRCFLNQPINFVFDILTFVLRDSACPSTLASSLGTLFRKSQLAYVLEEEFPSTIYPTTTKEEGEALLDSLREIRESGLEGVSSHLRQAAGCINQQDWAGGIRESIHAVESIARQIAPTAKTLGDALIVLEKSGLLTHPALKEGFSKIYGYTNDEQGIRHPLLEQDAARVGRDEAVFMFGACASFASYLVSKQRSVGAQTS